MLRHLGNHRTNKHNIRLAAMLCTTAGFVNGGGFLAFFVLTTNVTGHVAIFAEKLASGDLHSARIIGLWMFLFLFGAFISSLIINKIGKNEKYAYTIPIIIEIVILLVVGIYGPKHDNSFLQTEFFAGSLLFAMGLQNAMVSMISGSAVRTTHLTGMFTDLGIELASIISQVEAVQKAKLKQKIYLRLVIIFFFFLGCVSAAFLYSSLKFNVFFIPAGILVVIMFFDISRIKMIKVYRVVKHKMHHK